METSQTKSDSTVVDDAKNDHPSDDVLNDVDDESEVIDVEDLEQSSVLDKDRSTTVCDSSSSKYSPTGTCPIAIPTCTELAGISKRQPHLPPSMAVLSKEPYTTDRDVFVSKREEDSNSEGHQRVFSSQFKSAQPQFCFKRDSEQCFPCSKQSSSQITTSPSGRQGLDDHHGLRESEQRGDDSQSFSKHSDRSNSTRDNIGAVQSFSKAMKHKDDFKPDETKTGRDSSLESQFYRDSTSTNCFHDDSLKTAHAEDSSRSAFSVSTSKSPACVPQSRPSFLITDILSDTFANAKKVSRECGADFSFGFHPPFSFSHKVEEGEVLGEKLETGEFCDGGKMSLSLSWFVIVLVAVAVKISRIPNQNGVSQA